MSEQRVPGTPPGPSAPRRRGDPQPLSSALESVMRSLDGGRRRGPSAEAFGGLFGRWEEVVGADVARHVQPSRLENGQLVVTVDDPLWATQIRLLGDTIRARLDEVLGIAVTGVEVQVAHPGRGRGSRPR